MGQPDYYRNGLSNVPEIMWLKSISVKTAKLLELRKGLSQILKIIDLQVFFFTKQQSLFEI